MIINPREITFVRLLIPLILGILLGYSFQLPTWAWIICALQIFPLGYFAFSKQSFFVQKFNYLIPSVFFFSLGWVLCAQKISDQSVSASVANKESRFLIELIHPLKKGKYHQSTARLLREIKKDESKVITGQIHLTWSSDSLVEFHKGDLLAFQGTIQAIQASKNPNTFDFKNFKAKEGIYHSAFLRSGDWHLVSGKRRPSVQRLAKNYQGKLIAVLEQYIQGKKELAVAKALILGDRSQMDKKLQQAYGAAGALHVLAVSGLHVGIVYLLIGFLLKRLTSKKQKWLKLFLILASIWLFVLITGASPSVVRAAIMFSLMSLGRTIQRYPNIYNILAIAAFGMLLYNPFLIFNISFQLSFTAIISIIFFQPRIYKSWIIDNQLGDYIWKLTSLGVAAQIGTLPLTLFYFHQFPIFFWLSGIIVVPAASIILIVGLSTLLFHFLIPPLAVILSSLLEQIIWLVNACIFTIEELPMSTIQGVWISPMVIAMLYTALLFMTLSHLYKYRKGFYCGVVFLAIAFVPGWIQQVNAKSQNTLLIYHQPYSTLIDHWSGHSAYHFGESEATAEQIDFVVSGAREKNKIITTVAWPSQKIQQSKSHSVLAYDNRTLIVLNQWPASAPGRPITADAVLLQQTPEVDWKNFDKYFDCEYLIADGSNKPWVTKDWLKIIKENNLKIKFWDTSTQGAFVQQLKRK